MNSTHISLLYGGDQCVLMIDLRHEYDPYVLQGRRLEQVHNAFSAAEGESSQTALIQLVDGERQLLRYEST